MKQKLTQERLKELLDYDPETGVFIWKINRKYTAKKGSVAGCLKNNYWHISVNGNRYLAHRLAFLWMEGYLPENQVDHIDRNKINNRWSNLREVSQTCNMRNRAVLKNNKYKITGISFHKKLNKIRADIRISRKLIYLGIFDNLLDAVKARWEAEVKYNFPNCNTTSSSYMYLKEHGAI